MTENVLQFLKQIRCKVLAKDGSKYACRSLRPFETQEQTDRLFSKKGSMKLSYTHTFVQYLKQIKDQAE